ncbi:MAG: polysaccharide pyruvyl transferase family protein, partial [Alphaproteobacteria bacterium]|nr:polysaccharide pyruvyl transferase family protein [Alphaproteobacteria bacterium]
MRIYYYKDPHNNFGDDLNEFIWERLTPNVFDQSEDSWMSGIGSIINEDMPPAAKKVVFSSGCGYGSPPENFGGQGWHIVSVRGPLSAAVLDLPDNSWVTDGAILLSLLPEFQPIPEQERKGVLFMPNHGSIDYGAWQKVCDKAGVEYISPRENYIETINRIRKAKLVLADSMHAAIVADTLRVPWIPISGTPLINGFKWLDWAMSMNVPYEPVSIPQSTLQERLTFFMLNFPFGLFPGGKDKEHAIMEYKSRYRQKRLIPWKEEHKFRRRLSKLLRIMLKPFLKLSVLRKYNEKIIDTAADKLKKAKELKPYLSQDKQFLSQRKEMCKRLESIKELAEKSHT